MAHPAIIAKRRADMLQRFDAIAATLSERFSIPMPDSIPPLTLRDPKLRVVADQERMVTFLERIAAAGDKSAVAKAAKATAPAIAPAAPAPAVVGVNPAAAPPPAQSGK